MEKNDQISQIISLIFTIRQTFHEKIAGTSCCKASPLHIITLKFIKNKKPLMKEIADYLAITPPSATALVNNFIVLGLVKREEDKDDRRTVRIVMTEKGKKYMEDNVKEVFKKMRNNLETLSKTEQKQLGKILAKVVEAYKK
jgi:DNA-binding MarR family transcriptional regulator